MTAAKFKHNCEKCRFLGGFEYKPFAFDDETLWFADLYICREGESMEHVTARFGNEGWNISSLFTCLITQDFINLPPEDMASSTPALIEAFKRK